MIDGWTPEDDFFGPVRIDADEQRTSPVPHRYVHGFFEGTDTRFAVHLPEPAAWQGRILQFLQGGMGGNEHQGLANDALRIAFANGAVHCESNQGHVGNDLSGLKGDPTILSFRASRATVQAVTALAEAHYGTPVARRYLYGGSGGGLRSIDCVEKCPGLWDGVVPFIINRNGLLTHNWSLLAWATSLLGDRVADVADATDAGGSGDPFAVLDDDGQRDALAALYRGGFCRGAESQLVPSPLWVMGIDIVRRFDPTYFDDFWKLDGYGGADGEESVSRMRVEGRATVTDVMTAGQLRAQSSEVDDVLASVLGRVPDHWPMGVTLEGVADAATILGAEITFDTGASAGRTLKSTGPVGEAVTAVLDPVGFRDVAPGDCLTYDNRDLVAFAHHHRHMVGPQYPEMGQLLVDGRPRYPQRPLPLTVLPVPTGRFEGQMILVQHLADKECWPGCARAYQRSVDEVMGDEAGQRFRIWWHEHAPHVPPTTADGRTRYLAYRGVFARAVRDVIRWVEDGVPPAPSTNASFTADNAVVLPPTAGGRAGVQPVITPERTRIEAKVGEPVDLAVEVTAPPGSGQVVTVAWDLDGTGTYQTRDDTITPSPQARSTLTHTFDQPGTYFAVALAGSHAEGDPQDDLHRVTNLARIRIVVA